MKKYVTFNRALIAFVLIYFPIATLCETGSYGRAVQALGFLVAVMYLGAQEGKSEPPSNVKVTGGAASAPSS